jgi:uncharacterized membrane protein/uncharacterized RDD family membrane protein YckC
MVAPGVLSFDIVSVAVSTAVPGVAWALLFGLAWRHPAFAERLGLSRKVFWLLLPGALLASFALLPIAPVTDDVVAVSFAGAAFPLAVAVLALGKIDSPVAWWGSRLFVPLAAETGLLLGLVLLADAGSLNGFARALGLAPANAEIALVAIVAAGFVAVAVATPWRRLAGRAAVGLLALTSAVLVLTFAGSTAIPGVGIAESFPLYLLPPMAAGAVAVACAPALFRGREALALPAGLFAGGWGVVLGADVLRQPPLYGSGGPAGLYAIGGAGVLDLVYLSGFLGLLGAWATHRLLGRSYAPPDGPEPAPPPEPERRLREAFVLLGEGAAARSAEASADAARAAGAQARRLLGQSPAGPGSPWIGLGVPGWVVSDQANLDALARSGTADSREAARGFVTARALVRLGTALGRPRFASIPQRLAAFALDLAVLGGVGAAVFAGIVLKTPGGLDGALASVPFNAAIYGFVAVALLYFALCERASGATLGKSLLGIEVRDRALGPVDGLSSFVRNAPLLPVVTLYGLGLATAIAIGLRGLPAGASFTGFGLSAAALAIVSLAAIVVVGVGLAGAVGVAVIAVTSDRQRVGDLWAGTWVVRRATRWADRPSPAGTAGRFA